MFTVTHIIRVRRKVQRKARGFYRQQHPSTVSPLSASDSVALDIYAHWRIASMRVKGSSDWRAQNVSTEHGHRRGGWVKVCDAGRFRISLVEDQFYEASVCCDTMIRNRNTRSRTVTHSYNLTLVYTNISPSTAPVPRNASKHKHIDMYS